MPPCEQHNEIRIKYISWLYAERYGILVIEIWIGLHSSCHEIQTRTVFVCSLKEGGGIQWFPTIPFIATCKSHVISRYPWLFWLLGRIAVREIELRTVICGQCFDIATHFLPDIVWVILWGLLTLIIQSWVVSYRCLGWNGLLFMSFGDIEGQCIRLASSPR